MANIFGFGDLKSDPPAGGQGGGGGFGRGPPSPTTGFPGAPPSDPKRVKLITSANQFRQELANAQGLVVVDWSASWCHPCKIIFPKVAELSEQYRDVVFLKVDVDMMRSLAEQYNIRAMPTFHFIKQGQTVDELQGADPNGLQAKITQHHVKVKQWGSGHSLSSNQPATLKFQPTGPGHTVGGTPVPSSGGQSIGNNAAASAGGEVLEVLLNDLVDMGFSKSHATRALIATKNAGLEQAVDWIVEHPEPEEGSNESNNNNNDNSNNNSNNGGGGRFYQNSNRPAGSQTNKPSANPDDYKSGDVIMVDDEEAAAELAALMGAKIKRTTDTSARSVGSIGNSEHSDSTTTTTTTTGNDGELSDAAGSDAAPKRTKEEQELYIQQRLAEIKERKAKEEEEAERQRELNRIKNASLATAAKRNLQEQQRKDELKNDRRQKLADKKAKDEIRAKIQAAKEERLRAAGQLPPTATATPAAPAASAPAPAVTPQVNYTECALSIRMPNGENVKATFKADDTLKTVHDYLVKQTHIHKGFSFIVNYPRKVFSGHELKTTTLRQIDMVPRGALSVQK